MVYFSPNFDRVVKFTLQPVRSPVSSRRSQDKCELGATLKISTHSATAGNRRANTVSPKTEKPGVLIPLRVFRFAVRKDKRFGLRAACCEPLNCVPSARKQPVEAWIPPVESLCAGNVLHRPQPGHRESGCVVMGAVRGRNYRRPFESSQLEELQNSGKRRDGAEQRPCFYRVSLCIALNLGKRFKGSTEAQNQSTEAKK